MVGGKNITDRVFIDRAKCSKCNKCIKVCPASVIELQNKEIQFVRKEMCMSCGHCIAICESDALTSNPENNRKHLESKVFDKNIPREQLIFHEKRSVREFNNTDIAKETIEKLIAYAEKAPSSTNKRRRDYYAIIDKAKIAEMEAVIMNKFKSLAKLVNPFVIALISIFNKRFAKELTKMRKELLHIFKDYENKKDPVFRNAPCIICIAAPANQIQSGDDCLISQQYMMLFAHTIEIGSCIIGYAQYMHKLMEKSLNVPKGQRIYAVSIFGYAKYKYEKEITYTQKPEIMWF